MKGFLKWSAVSLVGLVAVLTAYGVGVQAGASAVRSAPTVQSAAPATGAASTVRPTLRPTGAPGAEQPVTLTGKGIMKTPPFGLRGGNYSMKWAATDTSSERVGCYHGGQLQPVDGHQLLEPVANAMVSGGQRATGQTQLYNLAGGRYYLDMSSGCDWSVTIAPQ